MRSSALLGAASLIVITLLPSSGAWAQSLVLNGYFDCQRATNGRAYCKRQGAPPDRAYEPVSEDFFRRYQEARTGRPSSPPVVVNQATLEVTTNVVIINNLTAEASDVRGQIDLMTKVLAEQKALKAGAADTYVIDETIREIEERLAALRRQFRDKTTQLSKYTTSIKPDDAEMHISARRESETYPKVPYYLPGTKETGEFWVEPFVSDTGRLAFNLRFVDVGSTAATKIRSSIELSPQQLDRMRAALIKASHNSRIAHQKRINRKLDVRMDCFPADDCPAEGQKLADRSSTEILFSINDDGSTNARIQRNKGRFEEGYNLSIASGNLLQAYINHVLKAGRDEFEMGSTSTEELKQMFR